MCHKGEAPPPPHWRGGGHRAFQGALSRGILRRVPLRWWVEAVVLWQGWDGTATKNPQRKGCSQCRATVLFGRGGGRHTTGRPPVSVPCFNVPV